MDNLKKKTFNNISYNVVARVVAVVFQAIANIILSRTLLSSDYGIVGFAYIFINFFTQFSELGLNNAVIQRKELDDKALYTGFTLKLSIGSLIFIVTFISSWFAVLFFDNSAVVNVIKIISFNFVINCFGFIPNTLLKRGLDYKRVSIANISQTIFSSTLAIILALAGFKYWSLVIANLIATVAMIMTLNILKPTKIRLIYDKQIAKELMRYGSSLSLSGLIVFAMFNVDNFLVGTIKGSAELGYYTIAFNWGSIVCVTMGAIVNNILLSTFSRLDHDEERIKSMYLKVLEYVSFISILGNITILIVSKDFLVYVLGSGTDKWMPALRSLQVLTIYGIFRSLLEPLGNVIMALGLNRIILICTSISALLEIILLFPAIKFYGLVGVSILVTITYGIQYLIYYPVLRRKLNISFTEFFNSIKLSILSALITVIIGIFLNYYYICTNMFSVIIKVLIIAFVYTITHSCITKLRLIQEVKSLMFGNKIMS
jgi:O-antigen/teichoic acid export membrane protein